MKLYRITLNHSTPLNRKRVFIFATSKLEALRIFINSEIYTDEYSFIVEECCNKNEILNGQSQTTTN